MKGLEMTRARLKKLYEKGQYQEILDQMTRLEEKEEYNGFSRLEKAVRVYYKSLALDRLSRFEEALQVTARGRVEHSSSGEKLPALILLVVHLGALWRLNRLDEVLAACAEGDAIIRSLTPREREAGLEWIAWFYNTRGNIISDTGELNAAMDYYQKCLAILEKTGSPSDISVPLNNIGNIYHYKGELDKALDYLQRGLSLGETTGNPLKVAVPLVNIGSLYRAKGELDKALVYARRSLTEYEKTGIDSYLFYPLSLLTLIALDQQDTERARKLLAMAQALYDRNQVPLIQVAIRLGKALVLKQSKRMADKVKAQAMLTELAGEKPVNFHATVLVLTHLSELLLFELKMSGEPDVLVEVKTLLKKLQALARDNHSFLLSTHALILRAKLAAVEGNLQKAQQYLDQARLTAEEKDMGRVRQDILVEQEQLEAELDKWQELIHRNAPLQERLEQARLENYLEKARRIIGPLN
ncbi:MAG: tetratricopeptide repeat protein [Candidatus Odinarchaeota archaeon]